MNSTKINKEIAELCGIILGDGNLHKSCNRITITGSINDKAYHKLVVLKLFNNNFNIRPILFEQKHKNAHYIQIESKGIINYFLKIGLSRGPKNGISVPKFIKNNKHLIPHFLRGLFDTDGSIKFSKQKKEINYYPRTRISAKYSEMGVMIEYLLRKLKFNYNIWKDKRNGSHILNYEISGKHNLEKWFKIIKPSNPVHISKFLFWKKFGYHIPSSTLNSRLKALNLNINNISQIKA